MKIFNSVAQMKLATIKAGQYVETFGYYTKGDAGAARYLVVASQAADEKGDHTLANSTVAVLQVGDDVNILQFGAVGDGVTDDTLSITSASVYADSIGVSLVNNNNVSFVGALSLTGNLSGRGKYIGVTSGVKPTYVALKAADLATRSTLMNDYWTSSVTFSSSFEGLVEFEGVLFKNNPSINGIFTGTNCGIIGSEFRVDGGVATVPSIISVDSSGVGLHAKYSGVMLADDCIITDSANRGLYSQLGGVISALNAQIHDVADSGAVILYGGTINCSNAVIETTGKHGLIINYGGSINADSISIDSTNNSGIVCESNGAIFANGCTVTNVNNDEGIVTTFGGFVQANSASISVISSFALYALGGGEISAIGASLTGSINSGGIAVRAIGNGKISIESTATTAIRFSPKWNTFGNGTALITTNTDSTNAGAGPLILGQAGFERTISVGVIDTTGYSYIEVDTEANAATDDLDTINGGVHGQRLVLQAENSGRTVVVKNGTGNLYLSTGTDFDLDHAEDKIELIYTTSNQWHELSRSTNS